MTVSAMRHADEPAARYDLDALHAVLAQTDAASAEARFTALVRAGLDRLPLPGHGATLLRWRALAAVAAQDLALVKFFEGHSDALAILCELGAPLPPPGTCWAMWAAEPPGVRVRIVSRHGDRIVLDGHKAWCSGALHVSHGLLTVWDGDQGPWLAAVDMRHPRIQMDESRWRAVGMRDTVSATVAFDHVPATCIGRLGDYLARPGFWQGGAGIAACWFGAATGIAERLRRRVARGADAHALAHLGAVDAALHAARAVLVEAATHIDREPGADAYVLASRARAVVESAVERVLHHAGRALGAGAFCMDEGFARLAADLPVFVRQSHAERDLAALAERVAQEDAPWQL